MWQVRYYDGETFGAAYSEWHPLESTARAAEADAARHGLVALVLDMQAAAGLKVMMDSGENRERA